MSGLFKSKLPAPPKPTEIPDAAGDVVGKRRAKRKATSNVRSTDKSQAAGGNFSRGTLG